MQLNSLQLSHVLNVWPVARLASLDPMGHPHQVPVVFVRVDSLIYSPIDGKRKRGGTLQRIRNVAANASVSILLDHYAADWQQLWWLRVDAAADTVSAADGSFERVVAALQSKYPQYNTTAMFSSAPTLLRFRPLRHAAWSAQPIDWGLL